jgi:hypothetical protein
METLEALAAKVCSTYRPGQLYGSTIDLARIGIFQSKPPFI